MVAALLEDHQPAAERRDPPADLVIDIGGQREVPDGVESVRVEPERHHDDGPRHGGDRLAGSVRGVEVVLVGGAAAQRDVQVLARAFALARLVGPAEEVRIRADRIGVDRDVPDVAAAPEDLLAPVPVVVVDVDDRDALARSPG